MRTIVVRDLAPALALAASVLATGCGTVGVRVPVMRPAEVNMSGYHSIGIGGLTGQNANLFATSLEEALIKSERFQVVDRENLARVMRELQLSASDLADPNNAARLGKQITAHALIFGTLDEKYREERGDEGYTDKNGVRHMIHKLRGEVSLTAAFKITDVSTGALIVAKTIEEKRDDTNTGVDERPRPIDREGLSKSARGSVLTRFVRAIVPHREFMQANFFTDGDLPQLETGVGYAQRGDWKKAQDQFNEAIQSAERNPKISTKLVGKAYWDLGLAYEYSGDYVKATDLVQKAYERTQDQEMLGELDNIKRLEAEARKVAEQSGQPAAPAPAPAPAPPIQPAIAPAPQGPPAAPAPASMHSPEVIRENK
jgi:tetratricopeptide (TPR) repeat protein